jgi:hypothetical protein
VVDPARPTGVVPVPPLSTGAISLIAGTVLATADDRLEVERRARESVAEQAAAAGGSASEAPGMLSASLFGTAPDALAPDVRTAATELVDNQLAQVGLLTPEGEVSQIAKTRLQWERKISLPTAGIIVKGCLDDCDVCEPDVHEEITLRLERQKLENELLKKQIDLLEKSQEYRCCPDGDEAPSP